MCTSTSYFTSILSGSSRIHESIKCRHSKTKKAPTSSEKYLKYYLWFQMTHLHYITPPKFSILHFPYCEKIVLTLPISNLRFMETMKVIIAKAVCPAFFRPALRNVTFWTKILLLRNQLLLMLSLFFSNILLMCSPKQCVQNHI